MRSSSGLKIFYELKPKWVKTNPSPNTCLCVYCENFRFILLVLGKLKGCKDMNALKNELKSIIACSADNLACALQECQNCPGKYAINVETLGLDDADEIEEVTYSFWDKGHLQKKTVTFETFLSELQDYTEIISVHGRIKDIQREAIREIKDFAKKSPGHLVLHVDFAKNWTVIFPDEVQSSYWKKNKYRFSLQFVVMKMTKP